MPQKLNSCNPGIQTVKSTDSCLAKHTDFAMFIEIVGILENWDLNDKSLALYVQFS